MRAHRLPLKGIGILFLAAASEQHFFQRSDNNVLAKRGIIAHTVSSFGWHRDDYRPSDDLAHFRFRTHDDAIKSMVDPNKWLVNSNFKPQGNKGGRP